MYIHNRVDEISSLLPDAEFVYVNKKANPSDLLSRGVSVNMMENSSLWWEGPPWLRKRNLWLLDWRRWNCHLRTLSMMKYESMWHKSLMTWMI